jgi:hypothetical protein
MSRAISAQDREPSGGAMMLKEIANFIGPSSGQTTSGLDCKVDVGASRCDARHCGGRR